MAVLEILLVVLVAGSVLLLAFIAKINHVQGHWKRRGVYTVKTGTKVLGHFAGMIIKTRAFAYITQDIYKDIKASKGKVGGIYLFAKPQLTIIDPDIVREVTVKHFDHFTDRRPFIEENVDKLLGRSILNLKGDAWRDVRHQLSPAFTGSKLRSMMTLVESTCHQLIKSLAKRTNLDEPIDMNEYVRRFAADVISTTAFGTVSDSLNEPDAPFYQNGVKLMNMGGLRGLVLAGYLISPKMMSYLNIPFVPKVLTDFFMETITSTIHFRETQNKSRPDMIQLLLDARKEQEKQGKQNVITDLDIVSQAFTFYLGGFDTIATALSFCTLLLAMHPEVQERLREEVDEAFERGEGKISYEGIKELKYMDMVVSEVLRLYPPGVMVDRFCSKPFQIPELGLTLEKGDSVTIMIYGFHTDPDYFPEPEKFDPERFSDENKDKIKPFTYMPFGLGPRNCIANRFALMEVKLCLAHILATNELEVSSRTQLPIKFVIQANTMKPVGGFWLNVRPRKNPSVLKNMEI